MAHMDTKSAAPMEIRIRFARGGSKDFTSELTAAGDIDKEHFVAAIGTLAKRLAFAMRAGGCGCADCADDLRFAMAVVDAHDAWERKIATQRIRRAN